MINVHLFPIAKNDKNVASLKKKTKEKREKQEEYLT